MNLAEKLRRQQELKNRNDTRLESGKSSTADLPPDKSELSTPAHSLLPSLQSQLERMRRRPGSTAPAGPLPALVFEGFFGGTIKSNCQGSFLHITREGATELSGVASGSRLKSVHGLIELLTGCDCDLRQVAFLDTETTGLAGGTGTCAFLVGLGIWEGAGFRIEQYFMRDYHEERAMLLALRERLSGIEVLVTFNGKAFDVPLLQSRFVMARQQWPLAEVSHLDLLYPARRLWKLRLGDCSLSNLETQLLQTRRELDVPGSEIPRIYFNYTRTGNPAGIREILHHNRQDIETLARLSLYATDILSGRVQSELPPEDLFSAGRYLQALGELSLAARCAESALRRRLDGSLRLETMRMLAALLKSQGRLAEAIPFWQRVLRESSVFPEAVCEELAICYEHRERDLEAALEVSRFALKHVQNGVSRRKWEHRCQRLLRKAGKQASMLTQPPLFPAAPGPGHAQR